ncbi:MAG: hypothetical protein K6T63_04115 [Alicyclobacillus herbarius]|uniref:hypothetical protein n=1 Tax=Alicyclobacillus herbarius TaxID=122960 RepID=UPI002353C84F|nr:hypothetical protein [Alicyclobacillus herbarius]MCL6631797.1 hypothetical protein [Alicyclobacillus herbarius]
MSDSAVRSLCIVCYGPNASKTKDSLSRFSPKGKLHLIVWHKYSEGSWTERYVKNNTDRFATPLDVDADVYWFLKHPVERDTVQEVLWELATREMQPRDAIYLGTPTYGSEGKNCLVADILLSEEFGKIIITRDLLELSMGHWEPRLTRWLINSLFYADRLLSTPLPSFCHNGFSAPSNLSQTKQVELAFDDYNELDKKIREFNLNRYWGLQLRIDFSRILLQKCIGPIYDRALKSRDTQSQEQILLTAEKWIRHLDLTVLNSVPEIEYYFVRHTVNCYLSLSAEARRVHKRILRHVMRNMHYDNYSFYSQRYNRLYPALRRAARVGSTIPIFEYLLRRKSKKMLQRLHR